VTGNKPDGIEPRGSNTWRITVAGGRNPETGRYVRHRETFYGTKTAARARRDELRVEARAGTAALDGRQLVAPYLEWWVTHRQSLGKVRARTAHVYRGYVAREITPRIGSMQVRAVRPAHAQRVIDEALKSGRSPRTVVQIGRIMHAAFRTAVRMRAISVNPCDGTTLPKIEPAKLMVPGASDIARALAAVADQYRAALTLMAWTGLRRGETCALRWPSVDLDGERTRIHVDGTLQRVEGNLVVLPPKSSRSRRMVPLPPDLAALLRRHRAEQTERRLLAGPAWHSGEYVFDSGTGRPIDPDALGKAFHAACTTVGLTGARLHDLRHAAATTLIEQGTNVRVVADLLGHSAVSFTLQTYVHPDESAAAAAVERLGEALSWGESGAKRSRR
jgi:integrase